MGVALSTLNDQRLSALKIALPSPDHTRVNDLMLEWLHSKGATATSLSDAWHQFLDKELVPEGDLKDRWMFWLGGLGYTGTIDQRWLALFKSGLP